MMAALPVPRRETQMPAGLWNGAVISASADTVVVERDRYLPAKRADRAQLRGHAGRSVEP